MCRRKPKGPSHTSSISPCTQARDRAIIAATREWFLAMDAMTSVTSLR